jgi:hypothetical protein
MTNTNNPRTSSKSVMGPLNWLIELDANYRASRRRERGSPDQPYSSRVPQHRGL